MRGVCATPCLHIVAENLRQAQVYGSVNKKPPRKGRAMADGTVERRPRQVNRNGAGAVTLRDVAERAGVSAAAVSRAFTPGAPISAETRDKVMRAAGALGYRPNRMASGLAGGRSGLIGLVADGFTDAGLLELMDHTTRALQAGGLTALTLNAEGDPRGAETIRRARDYGVEAFILLSPTLSRTFLRDLQNSGIPLVHAFELRSAQPANAQAGVRDVLAARLAVTEFRARGYGSVALLTGPEDARPLRDPWPGLRSTAERFEMAHRIIHADGWSAVAGDAAMRKALAGDAPDAVFCANDALALGALGAARAMGRAVPEALGIIGYDDLPGADFPGVGLSTVAFPRADIARHCVDAVIAQREMPGTEPQALVFDPVLIARGTIRAEV